MTAKVAARAVAAAYIAHENTAAAEKLSTAIVVGKKLVELKAMCPAGTYEATVWTTGIPLSTARLFARLARHADAIGESGVTSISEACTLMAVAPVAPRTRPTGAPVGVFKETSTTLVALAKALGVAIVETAAIESAVHGTDFADMVDAYVARAVELSADAATG